MKKRKTWDREDDLFRRQVGILLGATGMTQTELAMRLGISQMTLRAHIKSPGMVTKKEERQLFVISAENGLQYRSEFEVV